jgi:uncharacterized protein YkwD
MKAVPLLVMLLFAVSFAVLPPTYSQALPSALASPILGTPGTLSYVVSAVAQTVSGVLVGVPPANSSWVLRFMSQVDAARQSGPLAPCPYLSSFAYLRFNDTTSGKNYEVSHYNFGNDFQYYFHGVNVSGSFAEELLSTDGHTPAGFASFLQAAAPGHWQGLTSPTYGAYGFYVGTGPQLEFVGIGNSCRMPVEVSGEGTNMTQVPSGCTAEVVNATWLVIELASVCP